MAYKKILLIALLFTYTLSSVVAQNSEFFESANKAYNAGNYNVAISNYHKIIDSGMESFELYFNLGNAYYKINDVSNSIYFYEKAALIDDEHPSLRINLAYANQMTIDAINQKSESGISKVFNEFIRSVELSSWSTLSIVFMLLFVSFYLFFLLWNDTRIKRMSFTLSILVLMLSLSSYGLAARHQRLEAKDRPAIVFENTLVKAEPNERGAKLFELHLGTKVQIVDQMGDWTQIKLADGQQGWLLDQSIKALK